MRDSIEYDVGDFENPDSAKGLHARFYWVPKKDEAASVEAGRPVFKDCEYVEILAAGNANNIVRRPVGDMDRSRFRQQYAMFKQGSAEQLVGTPLSEIPWLTRSQVEELMYNKIRTLEQLAEVNDQFCNTAPGMYELKRKAAAWVQKASEAVPFTKMQSEMDALRAELEALKAVKAAPVATKG